jgi:O-antigen/teichoic acid export membrane protein
MSAPATEEARGRASRVTPRRAAADVAVQLLGQIFNLALGVGVTLLVVRALGRTRFGEWSTILALLQIIGFFASFGLEGVAIKFASGDPDHEREWIGGYVTFIAMLTVPVTFACVVILQIISTSSEMRTASLLLSGTLLVSAVSTLSSVFRLRVQNHFTVFFTTANSILWGGAVVAVTIWGGGMIVLAAAFLASNAIVQLSMAAWAMHLSPVKLRGSWSRWPDLVRVGVPVGIGWMITVAYGRIDQVLVFELAPSHADAGIYGAIYRVLDQAAFAPAAVMTTLFPLISAAHPVDMARVRRLVQFALDNLAIVSFPVFAFSLVAARPLVVALFGLDFVRGSTALPVLMGAYVAICFGYVAGYLSIVTGIQKRFIRYALIGLVVNLALNFALIPSTGFHGAAWATLATELVVVGLELGAVLRMIELRLHGRRLLATALAAALSGAAVYAVRQTGDSLAMLVPVMLVLYPLLLLALKALDLDEIRELLRRRAAPAA